MLPIFVPSCAENFLLLIKIEKGADYMFETCVVYIFLFFVRIAVNWKLQFFLFHVINVTVNYWNPELPLLTFSEYFDHQSRLVISSDNRYQKDPMLCPT